jgi:hypothetical protein
VSVKNGRVLFVLERTVCVVNVSVSSNKCSVAYFELFHSSRTDMYVYVKKRYVRARVF